MKLQLKGIIFFALILLVLCGTFFLHCSKNTVRVELKSNKPQEIQLFYLSKNKNFTEQESIRYSLKGSGKFETAVFELPGRIKGVRLDFGRNFPDTIDIKNIYFNEDFIPAEKLKTLPVNQIDEIKTVSGAASVSFSQEDPYIVFDKASVSHLNVISGALGVISAGIVLICSLFYVIGRVWGRRMLGISLGLIAVLWFYALNTSRISIDFEQELQSPWQVFYRKKDTGFSGDFVSRQLAYKGRQKIIFSQWLPFSYFRVDPGSSPQKIKIYGLSMKNGLGSELLNWSYEEVYSRLVPTKHISSYRLEGDNVSLESSGNDPILTLKNSMNIPASAYLPRLLGVSILLLAGIMAGLKIFAFMKSRNFAAKLMNVNVSNKVLIILILICAGGMKYCFPDFSLDSSWMWGLNIKPHLWGEGMAFSYGPMHWLSMFVVVPDQADVIAEWCIKYGYNLLYLFSILALFSHRQIKPLITLFYFLLIFVVITTHYTDYILPLTMLNLLLLLNLGAYPKLKVFFILGSALVLGTSALVKFNIFAACGGILLMGSLLLYKNHGLRYSLCILMGAIVVFAAGWGLLGQKFGLILPYFEDAYSLLNYHDSAMSKTIIEYMMIGIAGVVGLSLINFFVFFKQFKEKDVFAWSVLLLQLPIWYVIWKHGWVRNDKHIFTFIYVGFVLTANNCILCGAAAKRFWAVILFIAIIIHAASWNWLKSNFLTAYQIFFDFAKIEERIDINLARSREFFKVPERVLSKTGRAPVDVIPIDIAVLYAHGKNWQNRPMMQSYLAVSPKLDEKNAKFYGGEKAPEYILFRYIAIDGRYPLFDESLTKRVMMQNYKVTDDSGMFLLLEKGDNLKLREVPLSAIKYQIGEKLEIPQAASNELIVAKFDLKFNWLGRVLNFLFKARETFVRFELANGRTERRKVIRGSFPNGVIISRWVADNEDMKKLMNGEWEKLLRVNSIVIEAPLTFKKKIIVRFEKVSLPQPAKR